MTQHPHANGADHHTRVTARLQDAVNGLGLRALEGPVQERMDDAAECVAHTLQVHLAGVFELVDEGRSLLLRAGVGCDRAAVNRLRQAQGADTLLARVIASGTVMVSDHDDPDGGCGLPGFGRAQSRGIAVACPIGPMGRPLGVLVAFREGTRFTDPEVSFLESVGIVLAHVLQRVAGDQGPLVEHVEGNPAPVRVLLVGGHAALRQALAAALDDQRAVHVVAQAGSLGEARDVLADVDVDVDVAVLELGLPDGSGIDLIEDLRKRSPRTRSLVLAAHLDRGDVAEAVRRGAAAIMHKAVRLDAVLDAVRRLAAGERLMPSDEVIELLRFAGRRLERQHQDRLAIGRLTRREREVLQTLADGLDSRASAERLSITVRTQRNHVANIEAKLGVHSQLQAVIFAMRYGVVRLPVVARPSWVGS